MRALRHSVLVKRFHTINSYSAAGNTGKILRFVRIVLQYCNPMDRPTQHI